MAKIKKSSIKKAQGGLRCPKPPGSGRFKDGPGLGERIRTAVGKIRIPKRERDDDTPPPPEEPKRTPRKPETVERIPFTKRDLSIKKVRPIVEQEFKDTEKRTATSSYTPRKTSPGTKGGGGSSSSGAGKSKVVAKPSASKTSGKSTPSSARSSQTISRGREAGPIKIRWEEYRRGGKVSKRSAPKVARRSVKMGSKMKKK